MVLEIVAGVMVSNLTSMRGYLMFGAIMSITHALRRLRLLLW